jgi:MoaA/NifB/PqqE/SkfB family radical SAM enzyme
VEFLKILGYETFYRRLKSMESTKEGYDIHIVDTLPCYVGWTYTRILPNGDVIPCCKAHKKPMGNINKKSFKDIWFSDNYDKFRYHAKVNKKNHPYFKDINCYKCCDNLGMNLEAHLNMQKHKNQDKTCDDK